MKKSKFIGSVLVALVAVGLVAPQQAEASTIDMDGPGKTPQHTPKKGTT
jgi:hypothetical protein